MNFANSFLKDIKSNSSINQLGSKLKKNISDLKEQGQASEWLPDTKVMKEQIASAASQIKTAVNEEMNPESHVPKTESHAAEMNQPRTSQQLTSSSSTISSSSSSKIEDSPVIVQDMSQTKRVPYRGSSDTAPQPGSINLRESPRHRKESSTERRRQQPALPQQATSQPASVRPSPEPAAAVVAQPMMKGASSAVSRESISISKSTSKNMSEYYQENSGSNVEVIDSLELNALRDTNDVLKSEVQRLSALEHKLKSLNKEAAYLRDSNSRLDGDTKELNTLKIKCEQLEAEVKRLKLTEEKSKMFQRNNDSNMERLEVENANLKNKIYDLDKLVEESELNFNELKIKEQSLEKQNKLLENEIDRLGEKSATSDMHSLKLDTLEQANRLLENELETLKKELSTERAKGLKNSDLALAKQNEKIKHLEDQIKQLQKRLEQAKSDEADNLQFLDKQCDEYKKQIEEMMSNEQATMELQRTVGKLREDLRIQTQKLADEHRALELERKSHQELQASHVELKKSLSDARDRLDTEQDNFEVKLNSLFKSLEKKDLELNELRKSKDAELKQLVAKYKALGEENSKLLSANSVGNASAAEDLVKMRAKIAELEAEKDRLSKIAQSCEDLENELIDVQFSKDNATKRNEELENKIRDWEQKYSKDMAENKSLIQQQQFQLKVLKQQVTEETLKSENLSADFSLLKLEANKVESLKLKCDFLEKELADTRAVMTSRVMNSSMTSSYHELIDGPLDRDLESENKLLLSQVKNLKNDLKVRDQEMKQLDKLIESERQKTLAYIKQLDDLNSLQSQSTMQVSELRRKLVSLDLLTEECNQLRKNLTMMTIESDSRKAEITALNSQINILESTVKSLRESSEKHSQLGLNYENTAYELKKKQEDYKRLQHLHETVKREQQETIELLEEKLRDIEKKAEMQALKHEEVMLELELIRTRRDRLMPLCPNCSSQTMAMYQPLQGNSQQPHSGSQCPSPQQFSHPFNQPIYQSSPLGQPQSQQQQQQQQQNQALLSIQIPQQQQQQQHQPGSYSGPGSLISPYQSHLPHPFQVIHVPGKQSVTVECQTSPTTAEATRLLTTTTAIANPPKMTNSSTNTIKFEPARQAPAVPVATSNFGSQTIGAAKVQTENKDIATDRIIQRNQAITCNLCAEVLNPSSPSAVVKSAVTESKGVQTNENELQANKQKYFLYTCKYSYDPFKSSPNDNPEAELPLSTGEYLFILNEEDEDGFYMGESLASHRGLVPSNFVEKVVIDQSNLQKYVHSLPKNLLLNVKFKECANLSSVHAGQIILAAQQMIQSLPTPKSESTLSQPAIPSQSLSKSNLIPSNYLHDVSETGAVKIGLPYPSNIKIEKRSDTSFIVTWDPPAAPISLNQSIDCEQSSSLSSAPISTGDESLIKVQTYNLYLNHEIYTVINATEEPMVLVEDVDLNVPNRISIQALVNKDISSKPQECTLLFGKNRSFAPSGLSVLCLSQTSAIVSWWPSSSIFSHTISIDSIEHRTLKPGIFRFKLSGLLPDTSHLIIVTAQIPNHTNESSSNYAASVEFRTLPSQILSVPQALSIRKDLAEPETYQLAWQPVVNMVSNGIPIGGYSIYLDGVRVHQILNPMASSVSLKEKLLFSGAKTLTIRALSLDGNAESKDSETIQLTTSLMAEQQPAPMTSVAEKPTQVRKKSSPVLQEKAKVATPPPQSQKTVPPVQANNVTTATNHPAQLTAGNTNSPLAVLKNPISSLFNTVNNELNAFNENTKKTGNTTQAEQPKQQQENNVQQQAQQKTASPTSANNNSNSAMTGQQQQQQSPARAGQGQQQPVSIQPSAGFVTSPAKKISSYNIPRISDINKKAPRLVEGNRNHANRTSIDNDADLYENNRSEPTKKPQQQQQQQAQPVAHHQPAKQQANTSRHNSPQNTALLNKQSAGNNSMTPKKASTSKSTKKDHRLFLALFDYDPFKMSPNTDSCSEELAFKEGELIKVYGDQDSDGYYYGESNGRRGYIPSNMVSEVRDQDVAGHYGSIESLTEQRSQKGGSRNNLNNVGKSAKTTKNNSASKSSKDQSFVPINNYNNNNAGTHNNSQYNQPQQQQQQQQQKANVTKMVALYDYDPQSLSPNVDVDVELPFKTGDILAVIGEMDEDGFFMAELKGRRGLVPSNFLKPV